MIDLLDRYHASHDTSKRIKAVVKSESTALKIAKIKPEVPRVHRIVHEELLDPIETEDVVTEPRQKQPRVCHNCDLPGHNL